MAFKASGEDRAKRFKAYQELEEQLIAAKARIVELEDQLRRKSETVMHFARELANYEQNQLKIPAHDHLPSIPPAQSDIRSKKP
jgi:hypothetical protein